MVKYIGIAYLVCLGVRMLTSKTQDSSAVCVKSKGVRRALAEGIAVEALNVKTTPFFLALLPQLVSPSALFTAQVVLLGSICVALNTRARLTTRRAKASSAG